MYQMMQLKMHGFLAILYVCQEMVPNSQQPPSPEGGCWAPFSGRGTEAGPTGPRTGARDAFQHDRPPSSGTWGHSCSLPGALLAHTSNHSQVAENKSYWRWKLAEWCQLKRRAAIVRLLCDAFC
jgi:hypothetical protein